MEIIAELEDSPRGVYCGAVGLPRPARVGARRPRGSTCRSARWWWTRETRHRRVRRGRRDHVGLARRRASTTRSWPRPGCSPHGGRASSCFETLRHEPGEGFRPPGPPPRAAARLRRLLRVRVRRGGRGGRAWRREAASSARPGGARPRDASDRRGRVDDGGRALPAAPPSRSAWRSTRTIRSTPPTPCCSTRPRAGACTRRRGRATPTPTTCCSTNTRGEITESTIANVAVRLDGRWVDARRSTAGCCPGVGREVALEEGWLREGVIRSRSWHRGRGVGW